MSYNRKIIHALMILTILFLSLVGYLTYFQVARAPELAASGKNPRTIIKELKIQRGDIISSDGETLAYSEMGDESQIRVYPYENLYCHVIGYNNSTYGRAMLEDTFNSYIMGEPGKKDFLSIGQFMAERNNRGADLHLTIDHSLQKKAYDLLGDRKGSIVALDPKTGATLALVSKPDFDPNIRVLKESWSELNEDADSPLLARATSGLYPPGSSFKIITASAAVEEGHADRVFMDNGSVKINGIDIKNYGGSALGSINMKTAFAKSSNAVFSSIAVEMGRKKMQDIAERFCITRDWSYDIPVNCGTGFEINDDINTATGGMGQGDVLVTPMNMALAGCAVANGGKIMKPYLVQSADLITGENVFTHHDSVMAEALHEETAMRVSEMMVECVRRGTGSGVSVRGYQVAGKTGTAENSGEDHAWFVAYAPAEDPQIVVCAMVENAGGTGGVVCGPIVQGVLSHWLNN